jgi:hypothetical protein
MAGDQSNETAAPEDNDISVEKSRELWLLLTSWYLIIESARSREVSDAAYQAPQALRRSFHVATWAFFLTANSQLEAQYPCRYCAGYFPRAVAGVMEPATDPGKSTCSTSLLLKANVAGAATPVLEGSPSDLRQHWK